METGHPQGGHAIKHTVIWPSLMLMVGVSIPLLFAKRAQTRTRGQFLWSAALRAALLFLLGSFRVSLGKNAPTPIELGSALQPIGIAHFVAALLA
ncbi:MAG: hypothetical protein HZA93_26480 [Verrucomicrobia bacterium]|nr:hypothetical protein [Verrucomicrobiota bacterium]